MLRYANRSRYGAWRSDSPRSSASRCTSPPRCWRRRAGSSRLGIAKESDRDWPEGNEHDGTQELEIVTDEHVNFETAKIGSLLDVNSSKDPEGLRPCTTSSRTSSALCLLAQQRAHENQTAGMTKKKRDVRDWAPSIIRRRGGVARRARADASRARDDEDRYASARATRARKKKRSRVRRFHIRRRAVPTGIVVIAPAPRSPRPPPAPSRPSSTRAARPCAPSPPSRGDPPHPHHHPPPNPPSEPSSPSSPSP